MPRATDHFSPSGKREFHEQRDLSSSHWKDETLSVHKGDTRDINHPLRIKTKDFSPC